MQKLSQSFVKSTSNALYVFTTSKAPVTFTKLLKFTKSLKFIYDALLKLNSRPGRTAQGRIVQGRIVRGRIVFGKNGPGENCSCEELS
jgi:hypothetical protein